MNESFEDIVSQYDYDLLDSYIAQAPSSPRDSARVLVYNRQTKQTTIDTFSQLVRYLPERAVLVFNETKVLPARLYVQKETGGVVELLYIKTIEPYILVLTNKNLFVGQVLYIEGIATFTVIQKLEKGYLLSSSFSLKKLLRYLELYGETPIPPYIKNTPLSESDLKQHYQTVFAKEYGSAAAPTASLHFTEKLLKKIKDSGRDVRFVTLHVGLGTFAPLTEEQCQKERLHSECYVISSDTAAFLNTAKKEGRPIIAVGTTVVRTLESAADIKGVLMSLTGETTLFIKSGYVFRYVDGMITNFHVPRSSLLMLVAAFIGREKLLTLYEYAKKNNFRFFSFGDGMFLY
ncbi:MAG: tRNA preQ1(34) S-adenosylmethionine ribosyltransferase-isomerase QueA [bacterium]